MQEEHNADDEHRNHRHGALQEGRSAHFIDEGVVGHHRNQGDTATEQGCQHEVADHQRKDHQRIDCHRRQHQRQQDAEFGDQRRGAKAQAGLFELSVKTVQGGKNAQVNIGVIHQRHRKEESGPAVEGGQFDADFGQKVGQQAVVAEQQQPGLADDDFRDDDGHHRQDGDQILQREVVTGDHVGQRHADQRGQKGDADAQHQGVAQCGKILAVGKQLAETDQGQGAGFIADAVAEQDAQRVEHKEEEDHQRKNRQDAPGPPVALEGIHDGNSPLAGMTRQFSGKTTWTWSPGWKLAAWWPVLRSTRTSCPASLMRTR